MPSRRGVFTLRAEPLLASPWTLHDPQFKIGCRPRRKPADMSKKKSWMWLVTALVATSHANHASAQLSLFQTEMQAQQHCPNDTVVWLDFRKRTYYVKGQRLYAQARRHFCVPRRGPHKQIPSLTLGAPLVKQTQRA